MKLKSLSILAGLGVCALPLFGATNDLYPPQLAAFTTAKEQQEMQIARDLHVPMPTEVTDFFKSAHAADYPAMSNLVNRLAMQLVAAHRAATNGLPTWLPFWQPMTEIESAYEPFAHSGTKYPLAFANGIIDSIPPASVYIGGTDAGRMLVTAFSTSHAEGKPFYTITQNALSNDAYMNYLRAMYGQAIQLPTTNDVQKAIDDYTADAARRFQQGRLKPGENVRDGKPELNAVSLMDVHATLVKWILDHNPKREFYYEESYPLEVLYPYLSPHGFIFKVSHEVRPPLLASEIEADEAFWSKQVGGMLGNWLAKDAPVSNVCAFVEKVYGQTNLSGFTGDREFLINDFAPKAFSKLRVSIAGLYQWRLMNDGKRDAALISAADYAFRQSYALCPTNPEAVFRYINFLLAQNRVDDAVLLVNTTVRVLPAGDASQQQFEGLQKNLRQYQQQQHGRPGN